MALNVDLSPLWQAVKAMGAESVSFEIERNVDGPGDIDFQLNKGKQVELHEVNVENGLLNVQGRQILLYIPDQGYRVNDVLEDGIKGRRFHVADCMTLKEMREKGRYERYVATNDLGEYFDVHGVDPITRQERDGSAALKVCKNCLKHLNYRNYRYGNKSTIHKEFEIGAFFEVYSSFFEYYPSTFRDKQGGYSDDWKELSKQLRELKDYTCESCGVCLDAQRNLLHVHHVNGVKSDNRHSNLKALCKVCHADQPMHENMFVSHAERRLITKLRRAQKVLPADDWQETVDLCDPALRGVLYICQRRSVSQPEIGFDIQNSHAEIVATAELAWPKQRLAVAISNSDIDAAASAGWEVWTMSDVMEDEDGFISTLRSY